MEGEGGGEGEGGEGEGRGREGHHKTCSSNTTSPPSHLPPHTYLGSCFPVLLTLLIKYSLLQLVHEVLWYWLCRFPALPCPLCTTLASGGQKQDHTSHTLIFIPFLPSSPHLASDPSLLLLLDAILALESADKSSSFRCPCSSVTALGVGVPSLETTPSFSSETRHMDK